MTIDFKCLTAHGKGKEPPIPGFFLHNLGRTQNISYISTEKSEERSKAFAFPSQSTPTIVVCDRLFSKNKQDSFMPKMIDNSAKKPSISPVSLFGAHRTPIDGCSMGVQPEFKPKSQKNGIKGPKLQEITPIDGCSMGVRWVFDGCSMGVIGEIQGHSSKWVFDGCSMGVRWGMVKLGMGDTKNQHPPSNRNMMKNRLIRDPSPPLFLGATIPSIISHKTDGYGQTTL